MDPNTFPTKGNLILAKNSLKLSRQGYELMDKKRNILIREMMELIDQAKDIQTQIDVTFRTAYTALQKANMEIGIAFVQQIACTVPVENSIRIKTRSVMGTEIPLVEYDKTTNTPTYAFTVHDVEFCFPEWRRNFVFHDFHPGMVAQNFFAVFDRADFTNIQTYGRIEFQGISTGRGFGISEHHSDLIPQLVDKNTTSIGFTDRAGQFA